MSTADTAGLLADSAVELFASIGSSVVCQVAGAEIAVCSGSGGWLSTQGTVVLGTEPVQ